MVTNNLDELERQAIAFRDDRNWEQFHNPKDLAISLSLEAGEVLECFQWKSAEECVEYIKTNKGEVADELADVMIYLLTMSHDLGINLGDAVQHKLAKNAQKYPVAKSINNHKKYTEF